MKIKTSQRIRRMTLAGILLALIIVMIALKNFLPAEFSGSIINAAFVITSLYANIYYAIGFAVITPLLSVFIAPNALMSELTTTINFVNIPIIAVGNVIFVLTAYFAFYFFKKYKSKNVALWNVILILSLALGAALKYIFMWQVFKGVEPLFDDKMTPKQIKIYTNLFSITQLIAGMVSVPIIYVLNIPLDKVAKRDNNK